MASKYDQDSDSDFDNNSSAVVVKKRKYTTRQKHKASSRDSREEKDTVSNLAEEEEEGNDNEADGKQNSRKRIKWSESLHEKFLKSIELLGPKAVPSQILQEMNVPGLTREQVASHLQKHRVNIPLHIRQELVFRDETNLWKKSSSANSSGTTSTTSTSLITSQSTPSPQRNEQKPCDISKLVNSTDKTNDTNENAKHFSSFRQAPSPPSTPKSSNNHKPYIQSPTITNSPSSSTVPNVFYPTSHLASTPLPNSSMYTSLALQAQAHAQAQAQQAQAQAQAQVQAQVQAQAHAHAHAQAQLQAQTQVQQAAGFDFSGITPYQLQQLQLQHQLQSISSLPLSAFSTPNGVTNILSTSLPNTINTLNTMSNIPMPFPVLPAMSFSLPPSPISLPSLPLPPPSQPPQ